MKAKVIKTGEIINVIPMDGGWAANFVNGVRHFEDSELDFNFEDWEKFRREASKAAMQGILASGDDGWSLTLAEGYKPEEKHSYPIGIARFAIACADELIKQLKEGRK